MFFKALLLTVSVAFFPVPRAAALVDCSPKDCSPSCSSGCTYEKCSKERVHSIDVEEIPFTLAPVPSDACEFNADNITEIPFDIDGNTYREIPKTITKKYKTCQTHSKGALSCD